MPRKKKPNVFDQLGEMLKKKVDDASIRDLIYLACWSGTTYLAYNLLIHGPTFSLDIRRPFLGGLDFGSWLERLIKGEDPEAFQLDKLLIAMAAAYMVLKIDVEDVVSATKAIIPSISSVLPV